MELIHGFNAGLAQSIIGHPLDTYKIWVQMNHKEAITIKNLYRGFAWPAATNSIISALAFHTYETNKKEHNMLIGGISAGIVTGITSTYIEYKKISAQLNNSKANTKFPLQSFGTLLLREIPACTCYYPIYDILKERNYHPIVSGGIAGVTCWISSYWADVINTHVMNGDKFINIIKTLKFKDYFRGLGVCLPRAFIINSFGYYFYELSKNNL